MTKVYHAYLETGATMDTRELNCFSAFSPQQLSRRHGPELKKLVDRHGFVILPSERLYPGKWPGRFIRIELDDGGA